MVSFEPKKIIIGLLTISLLAGCSTPVLNESTAQITCFDLIPASTRAELEAAKVVLLEEVELTEETNNQYRGFGVSLTNLTLEQIYYSLEDDDAWYYYDNGIYRLDKTTGQVAFLYAAEMQRLSGRRLFCMDAGWIYYVNTVAEICRVCTNGQIHEVVLDTKPFWRYNNNPVHRLDVVCGKLLFNMGFELYGYDLSTGAIVFLGGDARQYVFHDGKVYQTGKDFSIAEYDIVTGDHALILKGNRTIDKSQSSNLYVSCEFVGETMYYCMRLPYGLYRYQNGESTLISDDGKINEYSLIEHDGKLFFHSWTTCALMRYDPDEDSIYTVMDCDNLRSGPKIIGGFFYYLDIGFQVRRLAMPEMSER